MSQIDDKLDEMIEKIGYVVQNEWVVPILVIIIFLLYLIGGFIVSK